MRSAALKLPMADSYLLNGQQKGINAHSTSTTPIRTAPATSSLSLWRLRFTPCTHLSPHCVPPRCRTDVRCTPTPLTFALVSIYSRYIRAAVCLTRFVFACCTHTARQPHSYMEPDSSAELHTHMLQEESFVPPVL